MTKLYAQEKQVFDINKVTVVGSPTITSDGVASGLNHTTNKINQLIDVSNFYGHNLKFTSRGLVQKGKRTVFFNFAPTYNDTTLCLYCETNYLALNGRYLKNDDTSSIIWTTVGASSYGKLFNDDAPHWCTATAEFNVSTNTYTITLIREDNGQSISATKIITDAKDNNASPSYFNGLGNATIYIGNNRWTDESDTIDLATFKIYVDGELIYSPTKPAYFLERRKEGFDRSKFTVIGSPTITEYGVASGFSNNNCLELPATFNPSNKPWKIVIKATHGELGSNNYRSLLGSSIRQTDFQGIALAITREGTLKCWFSSNGTGWNIGSIIGNKVYNENQTYYFKLEFTGTKYELSSSDDGKNWDIQGTIASSTSIIAAQQCLSIGDNKYSYGNYWKGSIDLTQFSITVDGKEVFTGAKEKFYAMRGGK